MAIDSTPQAVISAVTDTLSHVEKLWRAGDVDGVAQYYAADVVLTGEGVPVVVRKRDGVREVARSLMAAHPDAQFDIRIARALGTTSAETWIRVSASSPEGQPPLLLRVLLTWILEDGLWRIASESFSGGDI